jgi:hypothetical protein
LRLFSSLLEQQGGAAEFILLGKNAQYLRVLNCDNNSQLKFAVALDPDMDLGQLLDSYPFYRI